MSIGKRPARITGMVLCLLALTGLLGACGGASDSAISQDELNRGLTYLQHLEQQDPAAVAERIETLAMERRLSTREGMMAELQKNKDSVWPLFEDYVLLGDSRSVGFYYYEFLPESRVWAENGATILELEEHIPKLIETAPSYIYLCYGINDFCSGNWYSPEEYIPDYRVMIDKIQEALPNAKLFVVSILPASDAAYERANIWSRIPDYNEALQAMCEELDNCYYVDCDEIAQEHIDLWEQDGVHFSKEFYPFWAARIIGEVYSVALEERNSL